MIHVELNFIKVLKFKTRIIFFFGWWMSNWKDYFSSIKLLLNYYKNQLNIFVWVYFWFFNCSIYPCIFFIQYSSIYPLLLIQYSLSLLLEIFSKLNTGKNDSFFKSTLALWVPCLQMSWLPFTPTLEYIYLCPKKSLIFL